jgi:hypothetical protein
LLPLPSVEARPSSRGQERPYLLAAVAPPRSRGVMSAFLPGWDASSCRCHCHLRRASILLVVPLFLGSPVRLPGRRVTAAVMAAVAVLMSVCARTRLHAHLHARAPTHTHPFTRQGKLGPFVYLPVPCRARRRSTRCEPRAHR